MTKVSVIVPVYNVSEYLVKCLESLVNQTLKDIEIICINDGSTDNSYDILVSYAEKYPQIKILNQENKGLSAARNNGMKLAQGEFIGFVDSDDWVGLDFIEKLYLAAKECDADIAAGGIMKVKGNNQKINIAFAEQKLITDIQDKLEICKIPKYCYVWNKIYKRLKLEENAIEFFEGANFEDVRFTIRALYYMEKFVTVPDVYYFYLKRKGSIVKTLSPQNIEDKGKALNDMLDFADTHGIIFSDKDRSFTVKKITLFFNQLVLIKVRQTRDALVYMLFGFLPVFKRPLHKS